MSIRAADLGKVFRFLRDHGEPSPPDAFARPMLQELGALFAADTVEYFELRRSDRLGLAYTTNRDLDDPPELVEAWEAYRHQNPLGAFRWRPADGPRRLSSVIGSRQLRRLEYFDTYLRPSRIRDQLKVWLWHSEESAVCISLDRSDGAFSERDAVTLEVLQPHLAALHLSARASGTKGANGANGATDPEATLTRREAQVLSCLAAGRSNAEIAELLVISPATVRKHLENAYAKLGVRSRGEAVSALMRLERPASPSSDA
jgi:DNA-binding CsgD family transcriptional regulator